MPRTEEANQRVREAQRAKILDGATAAIARKGWAATMADVAAAAEVSQGLAYRYFANKEAGSPIPSALAPSLVGRQHGASLDHLSNLGAHLGQCAGVWSGDLIFHLHRFDDEQYL